MREVSLQELRHVQGGIYGEMEPNFLHSANGLVGFLPNYLFLNTIRMFRNGPGPRRVVGGLAALLGAVHRESA